MQAEYHTIEALQVLKSLESRETGLTDEEAKARLEQYGPNELKAEKRVTPLQVFLRQFQSFLVLILVFASVISFVLGETTDAVVIGAVVVLNAVLGFVQEYRAERAMDALKELAAPKARVLRGGRQVVVEAREIVPGDVLLLEAEQFDAVDQLAHQFLVLDLAGYDLAHRYGT